MATRHEVSLASTSPARAHKRRSTGQFVALFSALALSLPACGEERLGGSDRDQQEPPIGEVSVVRSGQDISLPLDAYMLPDKDLNLIGQARKIFEIRCMRRQGFKWSMSSPGISLDGKPTSRSLEYIDPKVVRRLGYHPPGIDYSQVPKQGAGPALTDSATLKTLLGSKGCTAEAGRKFDAEFRRPPLDARILASEADRSTRADSRFIAVVTKWQTCMKARGSSYPTPWHAMFDSAWGRSTAGTFRAPPSQREILVAGADMACRQHTNLMGTWLAVSTAYQNQIVDKKETQLTESRQILETWRKHALRLIASG